VSGVDFLRIAAVGNGLFSFVFSVLTLCFFLKWPLPSPIRKQAVRVTVVYLAFVIYGLAETVTHLGQPLRWQIVAQFAIFTLATYAIIPLLVLVQTNAKPSDE